MAWIEGTHEETRTIAAPEEKVLAWFADPAVFREAMAQVETAEEIRAGVYRWILQEKNEKGIRFRPDYTVAYQRDGNTVTWHPEGGNMKSSGRCAVRRIDDARSEIQYRETIAVDLPIPRLMAKVFSPIVAREIRGGVVEYLDLSQAALERS
ncbi:MAG: hypothetical protein EA398_08665 [Deltaproteobacteria bacterium]|nr:MAG: hypothetical protein EA398_08665 [Deltaproteobacteria bacterium]